VVRKSNARLQRAPATTRTRCRDRCRACRCRRSRVRETASRPRAGSRHAGERAVEIVQVVAIAMAAGMRVEDLAQVPLSFPTYAGIITGVHPGAPRNRVKSPVADAKESAQRATRPYVCRSVSGNTAGRGSGISAWGSPRRPPRRLTGSGNTSSTVSLAEEYLSSSTPLSSTNFSPSTEPHPA
jgi:hypothetical protein